MDYIIGFLFGFFLKDLSKFIERISQWDWENRNYYDQAYHWDLNEDDLP